METETVEVTGENVTVSGESVTIAYTQATEYSDNELLFQLNQNIVDSCALISALVGLIIGFLVARELFKIWRQ